MTVETDNVPNIGTMKTEEGSNGRIGDGKGTAAVKIRSRYVKKWDCDSEEVASTRVFL